MSAQPAPPPDARRVVLFDFDGVLAREDTFGLFMRERYAHGGWRWIVVLLAVPWLLVVLAMRRRRVLLALTRIGLLGIGERRYHELAADFAARLAHSPHRFFREGLYQVRRHRLAGDRVVIVTGCEDALVRGVLAGLAVDGVEVLASRLEHRRTGMGWAWHNLGSRKVEALAGHGIDAWQLAYSDSFQDVPMLAVAAEPVLVNATPKLCKRIEKALGRSVARVTWD